MKVNTKPDNIAEYKNIESVSEFKIKSNYHSFQILSSGLYANKIRAIIRELSCNAWDSHVAANNQDTPFDLHLPNSLEPYFAIRDYGTGLTHEEVVNIYTTYFESTKSDSNDFIGALGLGSKSPFSYTENFTVTAIKDGTKSIYTAFVNEQGVPSVARMADMETDEANGVEVKFSVENTYDFEKFTNEAKTVLSYFKVSPNFTGRKCEIYKPEYDEINVVDGINVFKYNYHMNQSYAIMGNIAYPIDVPNKDSNLGRLAELLSKRLEITFDIGDVEFQASREGLSYTKTTIEAIKQKLQVLQNHLDSDLQNQVVNIKNDWELAYFLEEKAKTAIWYNSVLNFINNKQKIFGFNKKSNYVNTINIYLDPTTIEKDFNITVRHIRYDSYYNRFTDKKLASVYNSATSSYDNQLEVSISDDTVFVKYDKKHGALQHVKHHFKQKDKSEINNVFILYPTDKNVEADFDGFFKNINNPPTNQIIEQSDLIDKPKVVRNKTIQKDVSVLRIEHDQYNNKYTWKEGSTLSSYDKNESYFYIPLSGYSGVWKAGYEENDLKEFVSDINSSGINRVLGIKQIYGIRKSDIEEVSNMKNWVNLQEYLIDSLSNIGDNVFSMYAVDKKIVNVRSLINELIAAMPDTRFGKYFKDIDTKYSSINFSKFSSLYEKYTKKTDAKQRLQDASNNFNEFIELYPLILYADYSRYYSQESVRKECKKLIELIESNT
jgi:hypothetical protein